jgi:hypothetical protein
VPTDPRPITLFEIVRRAVEISDPADANPRLGRLLAQFEDADEPVTAIENLEERVAIAVEGVDVEIDDPAVRWQRPRSSTWRVDATSSAASRTRSFVSLHGRSGRAILRSKYGTGSRIETSRSETWEPERRSRAVGALRVGGAWLR